MRLRLSELREVAKRTIDDRKTSDELVQEIKRVFGARVDVGNDVSSVTECANYILDTLEQRGECLSKAFDQKILKAAKNHRDSEVRRLSARLLPLSETKSMVFDQDSTVRHAAARRMPGNVVLESLRTFNDDDELRVIYRTKKIEEAAAAKEENKFTGDAVKQGDYPELSEGFYDILARKFINDYGLTWQQNWPLMVSRYVSSVKATSGVDVDGKKLYEAIKAIYEEREDEIVDQTKTQLKETLDYLATQMDELEEVADPVGDLLRANLGASDYIERVYDVYRVQESYLPPSIKKHRLGENEGRVTMIPQRARTPHGKPVGERDERVLDRFVEAWNKRQALTSEPLKLDWYISPMDASTVGFSIKLL